MNSLILWKIIYGLVFLGILLLFGNFFWSMFEAFRSLESKRPETLTGEDGSQINSSCLDPTVKDSDCGKRLVQKTKKRWLRYLLSTGFLLILFIVLRMLNHTLDTFEKFQHMIPK